MTEEATVADRVAAAVLRVPGVAGLHSGAFGEVASYLPGRRVEGVRLRPDHCEVHVVLLWGAPVLATADLIRPVVASIVRGRVEITVQDVVSHSHVGTDTRPAHPAPPAHPGPPRP